MERNPGWRQGHELACLTWLERANLTAARKRMVGAFWALWWLSCLPEAARFQWAAGRARACQQGYLQKLWQRNQNCDYFRHHGLKRWQDFRERLPLVEYADLQEWIERCARGQSNVLCSEPIRLFKPAAAPRPAS